MKRFHYIIAIIGIILLLLNLYNGYASNDWNYGSLLSNILIIFVAVMSIRDSKKIQR